MLESERGVLSVDYMMLEYISCVVAGLGFASLVFVSSLIVMLAHEGFGYVSRAARSALRPSPPVSSTFASRDLEGIALAGRHLRPSQSAAERVGDVPMRVMTSEG
jgi:hypothetical protein